MSIAAQEKQSASVSRRIEKLENALLSIRKAASTAMQFTNRLQFIYARANVALDDEIWDDSWKATHGYVARNAIAVKADRVLRVNRELIDALESIAELSPGSGSAQIALHAIERAQPQIENISL